MKWGAAAFAITGVALIALWFTWAPRNECSANAGWLKIEHISQDNQKWCYVAVVSEVLKWFHLADSDPCQLYDLAQLEIHPDRQPDKTCQDVLNFPCPGENCWKGLPGNNEYGEPEHLANTYKDNYGRIYVATRQSPHIYPGATGTPLSFGEIREMICPSDGGLVWPFIWAYITGRSGNTFILHDRVVFGFVHESAQAARMILAYNPAEGPVESVDEPNLEPFMLEYEAYAQLGTNERNWAEDVFINPLLNHAPAPPGNLSVQ